MRRVCVCVRVRTYACVRALTARYDARVRAFNLVRVPVRAGAWTARYLTRVRTHTRTHERSIGHNPDFCLNLK